MEKIRIIQIGCLHEHAAGKMQALLKLPDQFDVAGYVDERSFCHTPAAVAKLPQVFEKLKVFTLEETLADPSVRAVTVEVPNNDLTPVAMRCAERGLAMHMDKPAGETLEPYAALLDLCRKKELPFQMGYMFRGNPAFQFCIRAVRSGLLGDIHEIEADMNHCYGGDAYQDYIGKFKGGIMYNLGCHLIDFIVAALGEPCDVFSVLQNTPEQPEHVKNNTLAVLTYPHGTAVIRACSRHACGGTEDRRIKISGSIGRLEFSPPERFDGIGVEIRLFLKKDSGDFPAGDHVLRFPPQNDRYTEQLRELASMIRGEKKSSYTFEHDLLVHRITLAASGCLNGHQLKD